jgi:hypothetical protein
MPDPWSVANTVCEVAIVWMMYQERRKARGVEEIRPSRRLVGLFALSLGPITAAILGHLWPPVVSIGAPLSAAFLLIGIATLGLGLYLRGKPEGDLMERAGAPMRENAELTGLLKTSYETIRTDLDRLFLQPGLGIKSAKWICTETDISADKTRDIQGRVNHKDGTLSVLAHNRDFGDVCERHWGELPKGHPKRLEIEYFYFGRITVPYCNEVLIRCECPHPALTVHQELL